MKQFYQIAIDGPAGSGKSTIAKLLAKQFSFLYIDSGAMYRAITLYMINKKLLKKTSDELKKYLKKIKIIFKITHDKQHVFLNDADVTHKIRSSEVNKSVSEVSSKKVIRQEMVKRQKEFAINNSIVMDGRDIGTNVFCDADLKIYLTASAKERARRRKKDLKKN